MQAALLFTVVFPPPATGAKIFPRPDRPGTGRTTDAHEAFIVERIIGNILLVDIGTHLLAIPVKERVIFEDPIGLIPLDDLMVATFGRMFGAQTGDPNLLSVQRTFQRFYLTDMATFFSIPHGFIESVGAFVVEEGFEQIPVGIIGLYPGAIFSVRGAPDGIGLGKKPAGVQGKDRYRQSCPENMIGDHLVFDAEAGGEGDFAWKAVRQLGEGTLDG